MAQTKRKSFKGYIPDNGIEFTLESASDPEKTQTIICRPALPGTVLMEVVAILGGTGGDMAEAMGKFFYSAMDPVNYKAFREFTDEPTNGISIEVLGEIAAFLVEEYTARPTE
jgi:hypothetical protein